MHNKLKITFLLILALIASGYIFVKETPVKPLSYQSEIAGLVANYLSYYHYERFTINDKVSRRLLGKYLESLDYNKMFFLASDIEEFQKYETKLDDALRKDPPNLEPPFMIFNRYRQRVAERVDAVMAMLDHRFDFDKKEYFQPDRSEAPWARSKEDLNDLWRRRLKEDMVRFKLREKPEEEYLDLLKKRYERLRKSVLEYEPADVLERYLSSLAESFDPHSSYLKPETKENFDIQMGHSLEGIGATLRQEGEYTIVVDLVEGGPAFRSKQIQPNDKIIAVGQGDEEAEDVVDMRLDKVVRKIRGPKGTKVRLTIIPADSADYSTTKEVPLIRDRVELTSLDAKSEIEEFEGSDGKLYRVGVIDIPSFYLDPGAKYRGERNYKSTTRDVRRILKELEAAKVDGVVVDLRQNGGGSLDEAIQLTGLFIDSGPVVQIRDYRGNVRVERDPDSDQVYKGPLLVLTSVFSASASEIFSSAIQDYERGIVVGSHATHGKGTVQNVVPLQNALAKRIRRNMDEDVAGALKLTTHKFYRISGGSTQFKGVEPDITLPSPYDGMKVTEEYLDYALPWDEIDPVKHKSYGMVRPSLSFLKSNSAKRVGTNPEFRYVKEDVAEREKERKLNRLILDYRERLTQKKTTEVREEERKAERKLRLPVATTENDADAEGEDETTQTIPDFVLDEALFIIADYITFQNQYVAEVDKKSRSN